MKKQWKKEDFENKYIQISSEKEYNNVKKLLENLGWDLYKSANSYSPILKGVKIYNKSVNWFQLSNGYPIDYKYSDLQLEQQENSLTIDKLPERWYVKVKNYKDIKNYLLSKYGEIHEWFLQTDDFYLYSKDTNYAEPKYASISIDVSYTEISFSIFQKYVLNNPPITTKEEEKWKVGGWVKCIKSYGNCIKDKYYQIAEYRKWDERIVVKDDNNTLLNCEKHKPVECEWIGMNKPEIPNSSLNTCNMEKGEWVTNPNWDKNSFCKLDKIEEGRVYYTEEIRYGNHTIKNNYWVNHHDAIKLADLTEIQQYLPENHIDKISKNTHNMIKGKYYKSEAYGETYWWRFEGINGQNLIISGYRLGSGHIWKEERIVTWVLSQNKNITEISESEAKGIKEQPKDEFPEYIQCIWQLNENSFEIDKIYQVINPYYKDGFNIKDKQGSTRYVILDGGVWKFKVSTEQEYLKQQNPVKMFQSPVIESSNTYITGIDPYQEIEIGDEVELVSYNRGGQVYYLSSVNIGERGIIQNLCIGMEGLEKGKYEVKLNKNGKSNWWFIEDLKLVKKNSNQSTTINKKVDISSPKVGNEFTIQRKTEPKELTFESKIKKTSDFNIKTSKKSKLLTF